MQSAVVAMMLEASPSVLNAVIVMIPVIHHSYLLTSVVNSTCCVFCKSCETIDFFFTDCRIMEKARKPVEESQNGDEGKTLLITGIKSANHARSCYDDDDAAASGNRIPIQEQTMSSQLRSELAY